MKGWLCMQQQDQTTSAFGHRKLQCVPSIELPQQLTHLLAVVIHLTLLVGCLHLWRAGTRLIQRAQAI